MTRACVHHVGYDDKEQVHCFIHGPGSPAMCSGCKDFKLAPTHVPPPPKTEGEPLRVEPTCIHRGCDRRCCSSLFICRKLGDRVHGYCSTCQDFEPQYKYAPRRGERFERRPWEGGWRMKPWDFEVTVAIPVMDAYEAVEQIVELYRLQTERPYIILIDTGSMNDDLRKLAAEDVEVHMLRLNGVKHPSDFPATAMDLAFSVCRTEWLLATHADCFPRNRGIVEELRRYNTAVAGYEITPRPHSDWPGMVGHTLTMFHMPTMDDIDAAWSMRRLVRKYKHPDGASARHEINPATSPNWPDTELLINYQLRDAGIKPLIIGKEANATRTVDERIDHCRSWASAALYSKGSDYQAASQSWIEDGIIQAKARTKEWSNATTESR